MQIHSFYLAEHGWVPNNPRLPVILYRRGTTAGDPDETACWFEDRFAQHGWPAQWRDRIYDYHHYHSTAHEVLGVAAGAAQLMIGGPEGREIDVFAGDAILLPVGTGHRSIKASADFLVVGGYPDGQAWDICREAPTQEMRLKMATVSFPKTDPMAGPEGPLRDLWR